MSVPRKTLEMTILSDEEIAFTRVFHAPRALVFDAFTKPDMLKQWMWAMIAPLEKCTADLRPGGAIRYEWALPGGGTMGMSGSYIEFDPPKRCVHTELFDEDWTGGEVVVTTEFAERGGQTTVTMTLTYLSKAGRDMALQTDMIVGMEETFGKLDKLLAG